MNLVPTPFQIFITLNPKKEPNEAINQHIESTLNLSFKGLPSVCCESYIHIRVLRFVQGYRSESPSFLCFKYNEDEEARRSSDRELHVSGCSP